MPRKIRQIAAAGLASLLVIGLVSGCAQMLQDREELDSAKEWTESNHSGIGVTIESQGGGLGSQAKLVGEVEELAVAREIIDYWSRSVDSPFSVDFDWNGNPVPVGTHYESADGPYSDQAWNLLEQAPPSGTQRIVIGRGPEERENPYCLDIPAGTVVYYADNVDEVRAEIGEIPSGLVITGPECQPIINSDGERM